jgi:peptidyl-prolyl cis-trans isomerase SurA
MRMNKVMKATVIMLILWFTGSNLVAQDRVIDQIVAIVGGNIVLKSDIEKMYMEQQAQGNTSDGDMKCEIFEHILIDKLLIAEAEMDTLIIITDSQVNQQMEAQLQTYVSYFGSEQAVENFWKKPMAEIRSEMRTSVRDYLMSNQMRNKIIQDVTVTPSEVRQFYRSLPQDEIPTIPTQFEYAQIILRPEISLEEDNRVKAELRELKNRIEAGSSFAAMAVMYSQAPDANAGGEIGFLAVLNSTLNMLLLHST